MPANRRQDLTAWMPEQAGGVQTEQSPLPQAGPLPRGGVTRHDLQPVTGSRACWVWEGVFPSEDSSESPTATVASRYIDKGGDLTACE